MVAFVTAARAEADGGGPAVAEISYVGAAPDRWGEGLAAMALRGVTRQLAAVGYDSAQLLVYADNLAARRLYERLGWTADAAPPTPHPRIGRPEQRYRLTSLGQPTGGGSDVTSAGSRVHRTYAKDIPVKE